MFTNSQAIAAGLAEGILGQALQELQALRHGDIQRKGHIRGTARIHKVLLTVAIVASTLHAPQIATRQPAA